MPEYWSRFTAEALHVMRRAREMIDEEGLYQLRPGHVFLAMAELAHSDAREMLARHGVDIRELGKVVERQWEVWLAEVEETDAGSVRSYISPPIRQAIDQALMEAAGDRSFAVTTRHLLLGLVSLPDSFLARLLAQWRITLEDLRETRLPTVETAGDRPEHVVRGTPFRLSWTFLGMVAVTGILGWLLYRQAFWGIHGLLVFLFVLGGWLISLSLHEFGHALVAYYAGDRSVANKGYLTLDVLKYTHPLLSILFPLLILVMGGIGLPGGAVYIDTSAIRRERMMSLVSAAGPLATLVFTLILSIPMILVGLTNPANLRSHMPFWGAVSMLIFFQVTALVLNLLPLPGLDGFGILAPFLSPERRYAALRMGNLTFLIIFLIFWTDTPLTTFFWKMVVGLAGAFLWDGALLGAGFDLFFFWR